MNQKRIRSLALVFLSVTLAVAAVKAYSYYQEYVGFIEVCDNGIAHVPKGTQFVKCHGIVRKVILFEMSATDDEDCACLDLKCCDGFCYVFVEVDPEVSSSGSNHYRELDVDEIIIKMWISC
jgi:hypothetical protein